MILFDLARKALSGLASGAAAVGRMCGLPALTPTRDVYMPISAWNDSGPFGMSASPIDPPASLEQAMEYIARTRLMGGQSKHYVIKVNRATLARDPQTIRAAAMYRITFSHGEPRASQDMGAREIEFTNLERLG